MEAKSIFHESGESSVIDAIAVDKFDAPLTIIVTTEKIPTFISVLVLGGDCRWRYQCAVTIFGIEHIDKE